MMNKETMAEKIADVLEDSERFQLVDWNDLCEVTVQCEGKIFRMVVHDVSEEMTEQENASDR